MLVVAVVAVPVVAFSPIEGRVVAVVFPPWKNTTQSAQVIWDAGGHVLDATGTSVIAISHKADFFSNLRLGGALFVLDAENLAALCVAPQTPKDWSNAQNSVQE